MRHGPLDDEIALLSCCPLTCSNFAR
jgi:hypothetical protein